jgi:HSF-type DNA-binding
LNFYSFRKIRAEPDFKINVKSNSNNTVQFIHEYFRKGRPDLLHKITRVTKAQEPAPSELKCLKDEIESLHKEIANVSQQFDQRMQAVMAAVESDYQQRMSSIALSYQTLSALSRQILTTAGLSPAIVHSSISPLHDGASLPTPTSTVSESSKTVTCTTADFVKSAAKDEKAVVSPAASVVPSAIGKATTKPSLSYVTDGSSTSSREDSARESASPPPQPSKSALSLLSGIASAIMQEME